MDTVIHQLISIDRENIFSHDKVKFIDGILDGYDIDIAKIITQEINDKAISKDTSFPFPFLYMKIYLDKRVPVLTNMDNFLMTHKTTNLLLIWDQTNPIYRSKIGVSLLKSAFYSTMQMDFDTPDFQDIGGIKFDTIQPKPQVTTVVACSIDSNKPQTLKLQTQNNLYHVHLLVDIFYF